MHHRAKWRVEDMLSDTALPWTIMRQPTYLENFGNEEGKAKGTALRRLRPGVVSGLLDIDDELTVIAVEDLGALAAALFEHRKEYLKRVLVAGAARVSGRQLAAAASRVNQRADFEYQQVPW